MLDVGVLCGSGTLFVEMRVGVVKVARMSHFLWWRSSRCEVWEIFIEISLLN
jgi:hypothetical protein